MEVLVDGGERKPGHLFVFTVQLSGPYHELQERQPIPAMGAFYTTDRPRIRCVRRARLDSRGVWHDDSMEQLPYIDEHSQRVDAPVEVVWTALLKVLHREMGGSARMARILGCDPAQGTAELTGRPGEAVPGFRVAETEPGRRLALRGRHRFANYALTFVLDGDCLRAQTHAACPGILGRLYRAAVIGSGGHRLVTRRLLRQVARCAK